MPTMMKWTLSLLMAALQQSCASNGSTSASNASTNHSALYDPPTVSLTPGVLYPFTEGPMLGAGQKFHSDYSYRRAVIIGGSK